MDEKKLYEMVRGIVAVMKAKLPEHFYGKFAFEMEFRDSELFHVENVLKRESLDVERLK